MNTDLGMVIVGAASWLLCSFIIGTIVSTTTNVAGAFGDRDRKRDAIDWLIWVAVTTGTFFVVGEGCYWLIRAGMAMHNGTFWTHDAG